MFNCHAHPGLYTENALVCSADVKDISLISPFPYSSLGSLPFHEPDLYAMEKWAEKERFIGEVGVDRRFPDKGKQFQILNEILSIAEKNRNIVTLHQVGWTREFLDTVFSYNLKGAIFHSFTGSYETYMEISEKGGIVSLSPKGEKTKFFSSLSERGLLYPILTETDSLTGKEEEEELRKWNKKLSDTFDMDMEREVEDTFFKYIS